MVPNSINICQKSCPCSNHFNLISVDPWGQVPLPSIYENHLGKVFTLWIGNVTAQYLLNSTLTNVSDAREPQNSESKVRATGINEQATKEMGVAEEVTLMLYVHPHPVPLTSLWIEAAGGLVQCLQRHCPHLHTLSYLPHFIASQPPQSYIVLLYHQIKQFSL